MKRCIICGHVGSDDSTVCEVCGNPYLDIRESDYSTEEDEQMDDADVVYEEDAAAVEDTYKAGNDEHDDQHDSESGQYSSRIHHRFLYEVGIFPVSGNQPVVYISE